MAPPPEYDKEPKAPDKSVANSLDDTKTLPNLVNDQQTNSDNKSITAAVSVEAEDENVDALDEGQLRHLLDEAITYKCPKDREGKSSLFKNLLEEVEQDEQACEAACARGAWSRAVGGNSRRRNRRALAHSNSLQDLVAALRGAPETPPRRRPPPVSSRTQHGGSLPSGVDRYHCESVRGEGGYVATVHCVNPPHAGERRVSTSDAHPSGELELLNPRRSKMPLFPPVTYTARASLEIGSVGRAVTTTTASNQVRTRPNPSHSHPHALSPATVTSQQKLLDALNLNKLQAADGGGPSDPITNNRDEIQPRGPVVESPDSMPRSPDSMRRSPDSMRRSSDSMSRSPDSIRKSPDSMRRSPDAMRRSPTAFRHNYNKHSDPIHQYKRKPQYNKREQIYIGPPDGRLFSAMHKYARYNNSPHPNARRESFDRTDFYPRAPPPAPAPAYVDGAEAYHIPYNTVTKEPTQFRAIDDNIHPLNHLIINKYFLHNDTPRMIYSPGRGFPPMDCHDVHKQAIIKMPNIAYHPVYGPPEVVYSHRNLQNNGRNVENTAFAPIQYISHKNKDNDVKRKQFVANNNADNKSIRSRFSNTVPPSYELNPRNFRKTTITDGTRKDFIKENTYVEDRADDTKQLVNSTQGEFIEIANVNIPLEEENPQEQLNKVTAQEVKIEDEQLNSEDHISLDKPNEEVIKPPSETETRETEISIDKENINITHIEDNITSNPVDIVDDSPTKGDILQSNNVIDEDIEVNKAIETENQDSMKEKTLNDLSSDTICDIVECAVQSDACGASLANEDINQGGVGTKLPEGASDAGETEIDEFSNNKMLLEYNLISKEKCNVNNDKEDDGNVCEKIVELFNFKKHVYKGFKAKDIIIDFGEEFEVEGQKAECKEKDYAKEVADEAKNIEKAAEAAGENINSETLQAESVESAEHSKHVEDDKIEEVISNESVSEEGKFVSVNDFSLTSGEQLIFTRLHNNALIFMELPKFLQITEKDNQLVINNGDDNPISIIPLITHETNNESNMLTKNEKSTSLVSKKKRSKRNSHRSPNEVDSGVPFSCITTPEVVTRCVTTSSASQAVAIDPKPLELSSGYAAVASLTGTALTSRLIHYQPRSVISGFNALPLTRSTYNSPLLSANDEKKSLDENGNSLQAYNSSHSGSSQVKKSRKKKSSKNETVINIDQMDGYQGNKDVNELLRFIESDADNNRSHKLNRMHAKHKDDSDDKVGKKRATNRKDKEKIKRANSMEELSRTKLEDLTDKPDGSIRKGKKERWTTDAVQPAHNERRSWGDDSSDAFFYPAEDIPLPPAPVATAPAQHKEKKKAKHTKSTDSAPTVTHEMPVETTIELMDFQTVTKKKKPRKKCEDSEGGGGDMSHRKNRNNSPERRRKSAPPSDKSNDSNDDMDSVHSLPGHPAPRPHASYADIARTRHNIPDLIESCNFYSEPVPSAPTTDTTPALNASAAPHINVNAADDAPGPTYDVENYPALETRSQRMKGRDAKMSPPNKRIERKSAPDVVSDRRPAVILLDTGAGERDMDGVTFGFDINEQLLGGPAAAGGVRVRPGLWYLPPADICHPKVERHLDQIVNYVGGAWEDIIRCGNGKVRYFSE